MFEKLGVELPAAVEILLSEGDSSTMVREKCVLAHVSGMHAKDEACMTA
jgi:hypothetical protein